MGIVTKTGDRGMTSLYQICRANLVPNACSKKLISRCNLSGYRCGRVKKDDIRIEACGAIDEVSSFLGLARGIVKDAETRRIVKNIQKELIILGSELAAAPHVACTLRKRIEKNSVCILEKEIDGLEKKRAIKRKSFCIPGENTTSSVLDIARAITRRAERRCVTLIKKGMMKNRNILIYLNRLSDLLYLLARAQEGRISARSIRTSSKGPPR